MAESRIHTKVLVQLDEIEKIAIQKFDKLIEILQFRKTELISEIKNLRNEVSGEEVERKDRIGQIKVDLDSIEGKKLENLSEKIQFNKKEIREMGNISIKFICNISDFEEKITVLGKIVKEVEPRYSVMMSPIQTIEHCHLSRPTSVCISEEQELIYIVDNGNHQINIFSMDYEFKQNFEDKKWKDPWGIAVDKNNLYVTDMAGHNVLRYDCSSNLNFVKNVSDLGVNQEHSTHKFKPQGITVYENNGEVYVTDINNNNVKVYSSDLEFKHTFGSDFLRHPVDVKIHGDNVYVLDNNKPCMHVFNMSGSPCQDIYFLNGSTPIETPLFFNIDCAGNFLVSNWRQDAVNIVRSEGDVKYTIESNAESGSVLKTPRGVAVTRSGRVVIVSDTPKNWIQIF